MSSSSSSTSSTAMMLVFRSTMIWKKDGRMISAGKTVIRKDHRMSLVRQHPITMISMTEVIWIHLEQQVTTLLLKVSPRRWTPAWRYLRCAPTTRERTSATWRRTGNPSTRSTPLMFLFPPLFRWDPIPSLSLPRIGIFLVLFYGFVFNLVYLQAQPSNGKFVVRSGSTITLECRAQGNPMPRVSWTRLVRVW